jgi:hypothetical protein
MNSSNTADMLFACGIERSDDNGEAEVGDAAYYFPKLNLSASLYDKFNHRAHSETGGLLSTALDQGQTTHSLTEDAGLALTPASESLSQQARNTPLIATTAATEGDAGTTTSGRSDNYYTANDYDQWGLLTTVTGGPACEYYVAEFSNVTGTFEDKWFPSDAAGNASTQANAQSVADGDSDQDTAPDSLAGYTLTGNTYTLNLNGGGSVETNIIVGPADCNSPDTTIYDFDRTIVLNMTENVTAPADLETFKAQQGV